MGGDEVICETHHMLKENQYTQHSQKYTSNQADTSDERVQPRQRRVLPILVPLIGVGIGMAIFGMGVEDEEEDEIEDGDLGMKYLLTYDTKETLNPTSLYPTGNTSYPVSDGVFEAALDELELSVFEDFMHDFHSGLTDSELARKYDLDGVLLSPPKPKEVLINIRRMSDIWAPTHPGYKVYVGDLLLMYFYPESGDAWVGIYASGENVPECLDFSVKDLGDLGSYKTVHKALVKWLHFLINNSGIYITDVDSYADTVLFLVSETYREWVLHRDETE